MSPDELRLIGLLIVLVIVGLAHHAWHVHRYPHRACRGCDGSGKVTGSDLLGRTVIGPCRRCGGTEPTTPRRWVR